MFGHKDKNKKFHPHGSKKLGVSEKDMGMSSGDTIKVTNDIEHREEADEIMSRELYLWGDNTEHVYRRMLAFAKNYKNKKEKGVFDKSLALKGMEHLANEIIMDYRKANGLGTVDRPTKELLKRELLDRVERAIIEKEV